MLPQGPVITKNLPEALAAIPIRAELELALQRALEGLHFTRPTPAHPHLATSGALIPHLPPPLASR